MRAPQAPHSLSKVWIKMAVEDGIANHLVAVSAAVVSHLQRKGSARPNGLAVIVTGVVTIRRVNPLVRVLVMDVMFLHAAVQDAELGVITDIAVIHVRGVVRIEDLGSLRA